MSCRTTVSTRREQVHFEHCDDDFLRCQIFLVMHSLALRANGDSGKPGRVPG